ncbi:hypothetical protein Droror1_Dr00001240 [Drosera rotundifolia]
MYERNPFVHTIKSDCCWRLSSCDAPCLWPIQSYVLAGCLPHKPEQPQAYLTMASPNNHHLIALSLPLTLVLITTTIPVSHAARHLLQLPATSPQRILPDIPGLPILPLPGPLPTLPVLPSGLQLMLPNFPPLINTFPPVLPRFTFPPTRAAVSFPTIPGLPTIPTVFPSVPVLAPPPSK